MRILIKNEAGISLVENVLSMAILMSVAVGVAPVLMNAGKISKGSNIREVCQRLVNAKIAKYRSMGQNDVRTRYEAYRGASSGTKLCGNHPNRVYSTAYPSTAPIATTAPSTTLRANIVSNGGPSGTTYGPNPALGIRECVQLSGTAGNDIIPGDPNLPYGDSQGSYNYCNVTTPVPGLRDGDKAAVTQMPGMKMYVSMSIVDPWGGTNSYTCPSTFPATGMNQSVEVIASAVVDYRSVGLDNSNGEVDTNKLTCSARATIPIVSSSNTQSFRYFARSDSGNGTWVIRKFSDGINASSPAPVYAELSAAMSTWTPNPSANVTLGTADGQVTQFGVSPGGDHGFFIKVYESTATVQNTSFFCVMSGLSETSSGHNVTCSVLPRYMDNQIEFVMIDYQNGKMWGLAGSSNLPDRNGTPAGNQYITSKFLLADCSNLTDAATREAALFAADPSGSGCTINSLVQHTAGATYAPPTGTLATTMKQYLLDDEYLALSPDQMWQTTPPTLQPVAANHIQARAIRDVDSMFVGGALTVPTSVRDCIRVNNMICSRHAFARLFFSPDALSAYAVMRYPKDATEYVGQGSNATCPNTTAYDAVDRLLRIYKLEIPNPAGANSNAAGCPVAVSSYSLGALSTSSGKFYLVSF